VIQNVEQHYKVLGLEPGASLEEVNQAYKDLVFIWHPDRLPQENARLIQKSVEKLQQINEARDSLRSYHRKSKKTTATAKTESKPASKNYYNDNRSQSNNKTDPNSNNYQQTYSRPGYQPPKSGESKQTWNYREYYASSQKNTGNSTGTDGYKDFREFSKNYGSNRQAESNYKRPYYKDLRGANLSRSDFKERDFSGQDLSQADLSYADLSDTFLHKIILEEANLQGANLKGANLLQANLRKANLREANLIGADLSGSDLSGADLSGAKVGFNNKVMVKLTAVKLTGAILPDGSVHP
jgi:curved DNA-binding protein CbpA